MSVFKCKMCGGTLEIATNETVAICEYCGTQQTLPKLDDDRRAQMYDRANHFRRNNEFDKAMGIYEQILNEDNTDSEAYWSLVLCRYGIEYVEDPVTHKRVPTVNRAQFTSIFDDDNYKSALQHADTLQKTVYEAEAKAINEIQKGILAISQQEEPFDVFICYKETDNNGRRTPDSVLANDLYHQLTQEGFKVFFARITLEDKLGSAYEPYIFAALNSAKVMVVLGTKPEFFNAVWVKNEWARYLSLVKQSAGKKMLIPAYKDMDPYDLPEEFSHLQAQDMSKLGFMQDLIRGIKKIISADAPASIVKETVVVNNAAANSSIAPLLKRAFMFLEDGDFAKADDFAEQVLNLDPECAEAYLVKLMAEFKINKRENLKSLSESFENSINCQKFMRFADSTLKTEIQSYIDFICNAKKEAIYQDALDKKLRNTPSYYDDAINLFSSILDYKDAEKKIEECKEFKNQYFYLEGKKRMSSDNYMLMEEAINYFSKIKGYKDTDTLINECQNKINQRDEKLKIAAEKVAKKRKKAIAIGTSIAAVLIVFVILFNTVIMPKIHYNRFVDKYGQEYIDRLHTLSAGDILEFGAYEQDNNTSNGKEAIEWLVLAKEENRVLVISKYALDCRQYNTSYVHVTWENCTLRKWLNNDFINSAFTEEEKAMIPTVTVSADKNPEYDTNPGNKTQDKVFLLSITEAEKYFTTDAARKCVPTEYAIEQGAYTSSSETSGGKATCWWWLRSPGCSQYNAALVDIDGSVYCTGFNVHTDNFCVRPALWITLDS